MKKKLLQGLVVATFSIIFTSGSLVAMSSEETHKCKMACLQEHETCEGNCPEPSYSGASKSAHASCIQACMSAKATCDDNCK